MVEVEFTARWAGGQSAGTLAARHALVVHASREFKVVTRLRVVSPSSARFRVGTLGIALVAALSACGGSPAAPTPPASQTPVPQLSIQVAPNPLQATLRSASATTATFQVAPTMTFQEQSGASGQITQLTATITRHPSGESSTGSLPAGLSIAARGSATSTFAQDFDVTSDVDNVTWHVAATGIDSNGRAFTATSAEVAVNPPAVTPPPVAMPVRYEVWGGPNHAVFLGCWSCNEFAPDSVFNQFGRYGGRFSQTSIWNHFSQYGSEFNTNGACNQFATNPPILVNTSTNRFTELTLNQFRQFAERDPATAGFLRTTICEVR